MPELASHTVPDVLRGRSLELLAAFADAVPEADARVQTRQGSLVDYLG